jgi:hypothetical protein
MSDTEKKEVLEQQTAEAKVKPGTAAKKSKKSETVKSKRVSAQVYVGPNLSAPLFLKRFQVFAKGVLPAHLQKACDDDQDLRTLFVRFRELGKAKRDLQRKTSRLAKAYDATFRKQVKKEV